MQLQDISSRLIQSISVGICIVEAETGVIISQNDTFGTWFDTAVTGQVLDIGLAVAFGELPGRKPVEVRTKVKRRTLVIELSAHEALHNGTRLIVVEGQNISRLRETEAMIDSYSDMVDRRTRELEREKTQVEKLLLNIMPRSVYEEYMTFGSVAPRLFEPVSVLMLDFVDFTRMAAAGDPNVTVAELNDIFTAFDRISELHGCERIKTVGDCYMAVTGLPHPTSDHAVSAARAAAKMIRYLKRRNQTHEHTWTARIGIATGSVVGSVVGVQKYIYDVFGPAVNMAARLQAQSEPMEITICASMRDSVLDEFDISPARVVPLRGFGETEIAQMSEPGVNRRVA
ncbi:adenylate/guanylate cyclase domain-containing protein [uncultured Tateyamaria sp.]|uniref:adenylate/guanylate cyclase domain-containing protein n=1 Tax=uncultured Tateyamaria sp. TaxID=455651 RepID=UPI002620F275|nr:adenylate/guanylate cyclase domain-containing protein [uncultured Tateyamaria sp.]